MKKTWTKEDDDKLRELVALGMSYREIGKMFGVSKDAAIGRAWRQGMMQAKEMAKVPFNERLAAMEMLFPARRRCVFPIGHPGEPGFHFCGEPVRIYGEPYCAGCRAKAWTKGKAA